MIKHTHTRTHARTHARMHARMHPFNGPFPGLSRWAGNRKVKPIWTFLKQETVSGSGISWAICKCAPCSRQVTTPAPHHSVFCRPDALPVAQPTASKHGTGRFVKNRYYNTVTFLRVCLLTIRSESLTFCVFNVCCIAVLCWSDRFIVQYWLALILRDAVLLHEVEVQGEGWVWQKWTWRRGSEKCQNFVDVLWMAPVVTIEY